MLALADCLHNILVPCCNILHIIYCNIYTYLHCTAVRWLCDLWARIAADDVPLPPADARVLLLGDGHCVVAQGRRRARQPGLWLHLRLLWCRAV
jgi:hypothetical protein